MFRFILVICMFSLFLFACKTDSKKASGGDQPIDDPLAGLTVSKVFFGNTPDGQADLYTLTNDSGMEVKVTNYGGIITSIRVPDKEGNLGDVVLGFDSLSGYLSDKNPYFGSIIGRYGNRIGKGRFTLEGREYELAANDGENHLHGGNKGFDKVLWSAKESSAADARGIELSYTSKDMEEGYPGNLSVKVFYFLKNNNELLIRYEASTDKTTICNLTNHAYFNLAGEGNGTILNHELRIAADWITPVDEGLIPTGEMMPVKDTPFDFRTPKAIGRDINADDEQIRFGLGYDHNFALGEKGGKPELVATVYEPLSGRFMEVLTEEPGVQFYTGNFLDGTITGKEGHIYGHRTGFCLETQHYPDSPNQEKFPSVVLQDSETYRTSTVYRFSVK